MFQHETLENLSHQVKIQDMEPEVFQEMLRFIYTGRMSPLKIKKADDWTFTSCWQISSRDFFDSLWKVFGERNIRWKLNRIPLPCRWPFRKLLEAERTGLSPSLPGRGDGHRRMEPGETRTLHLAMWHPASCFHVDPSFNLISFQKIIECFSIPKNVFFLFFLSWMKTIFCLFIMFLLKSNAELRNTIVLTRFSICLRCQVIN